MKAAYRVLLALSGKNRQVFEFREKDVFAKAQITVAIGIPLIYLWFLGIPPGSPASTFGDSAMHCSTGFYRVGAVGVFCKEPPHRVVTMHLGKSSCQQRLRFLS